MRRSSLASWVSFAFTSVALFACGDDSSGTGGSGGEAATTTASTTGAGTTTATTTTGSTSSTGTSGGGGATGVSCEAAEDGDPCDNPGESCGAVECYGCTSICVDGLWNVSCTEAPTCDAEPVAWGTACDDFCGPFECGAYDLETPCGTESLVASCGPFGWAYTESTCFPDCRTATDPDACGALLDCVWVQPCEGSDDTTPRCASLGAPPAEGGMVQQFCGDQPCPVDQTCVELSVNPNDLTSGDCSGSGSVAAVCQPALPPG